ncbi:uncharacterized protein LOC106709483 [Papilio machaon]|uniref:uncharacterized protein LOC106709483 n=1 Tax=Papilio machaon TaxID=76193 RepID=UPI001E66346F|nr:uncharacterized protein LOC106709483 [Papilio machaon]
MDYSQVQSNMDDMIKMFHTKMAEFQADLQQATSRKPPNTIAALNTEFQTFKSFVCGALNILRAEVDALARGLDRVETRSRRKMLLIHGVPEAKDENVTDVVAASLSARCKMADITPACIRTCHRMGKPRDDANPKPRPIVIKFKDVSLRDRIWNAKKTLKGTKITLSEFLTKPRHNAFMVARDYFGVSSCWTRDGCIHIKTIDGSRHKIESLAELQKLQTSHPRS